MRTDNVKTAAVLGLLFLLWRTAKAAAAGGLNLNLTTGVGSDPAGAVADLFDKIVERGFTGNIPVIGMAYFWPAGREAGSAQSIWYQNGQVVQTGPFEVFNPAPGSLIPVDKLVVRFDGVYCYHEYSTTETVVVNQNGRVFTEDQNVKTSYLWKTNRPDLIANARMN